MKSTPEIRHFCTYFDRNYLFKGLALYKSLIENCVNNDFIIWILCLDDETFEILSKMKLTRVELITLTEIETFDKQLLAAKVSRSIVEYYWTCTPVFLLYMLDMHKEVNLITYLDADLYFFSSPEPVFDTLGKNSVLIVPHRFSPEYADRESRGIYNVSLLIFRRNENSYECLRWWREKCLINCSLESSEGTCGDQKYLDEWPSRFNNVAVLQHIGGGLAPWNISQYRFARRRKTIFVDADILIFYHFHAFGIISGNIFEIAKGYSFSCSAIRLIYLPYIRSIKRSIAMISRISPNFRGGYVALPTSKLKGFFSSLWRLRIVFYISW